MKRFPAGPQAAADVRPTGFTAVELIVAVAVVGLLLAVLVPAVQAVRESGRATECRSHLHQFGVALSGFEATHGRLPSNAGPTYSVPGADRIRTHIFSPHFQLLPWFEQQSIYSQVAFSGSTARFQSLPVRLEESVIPAFLCPSDPTEHGTNYRVSFGPRGRHCMSSAMDRCRNGGAFAVVGGVRLADVVDGLSQTLALSERTKSDDRFDSFSASDFWYSGAAALPGALSDEQLVAIARSFQPPPAYFQARAGHDWHLWSFGATAFNQLLTPNSNVLDCSADSVTAAACPGGACQDHTITAVGVFAARSQHPGRVHTLSLDGAVSDVADSVDHGVWQSLGTIAHPPHATEF